MVPVIVRATSCAPKFHGIARAQETKSPCPQKQVARYGPRLIPLVDIGHDFPVDEATQLGTPQTMAFAHEGGFGAE